MMLGIQDFYAGFLSGSLRNANIIRYRSRGNRKICPLTSVIDSADPQYSFEALRPKSLAIAAFVIFTASAGEV
jgi:hypothetical protein